MQHISSLFANYEFNKTKITSRRADLIKQFVDELNIERLNTKYPPIKPGAVAIKLSHLSEFDLSSFLSMAKDYKNRKGSFSKYFWGALKNK